MLGPTHHQFENGLKGLDAEAGYREALRSRFREMQSRNVPVIFSLMHLAKLSGVRWEDLRSTVKRERVETDYHVYAGSVNLSCMVSYTGTATIEAQPTCSLSSSNVSVTAGGTATSTLSIATTVPLSSQLEIPASSSGGGTGGIAFASILLGLMGVFAKRKALTRGRILGIMLLGCVRFSVAHHDRLRASPYDSGNDTGHLHGDDIRWSRQHVGNSDQCLGRRAVVAVELGVVGF